MSRNWLFVSLLACLSATPVAAQSAAPDLAPYLMTDHAEEVALARTAAPASISGAATILVLTRKGYVDAAQGTNGFTCLVLRSFAGALSDPSSWWNPRIRAPLCLNAAAVRSTLPEMKQRAMMLLGGISPADVIARTYTGYARNQLPPVEMGAMAYMLSHKQYLADVDPHWMPHVMFFYGGGRKATDWGAGDGKAPIIDGGFNPKTGNGTILIPVTNWSDGTAFKRP